MHQQPNHDQSVSHVPVHLRNFQLVGTPHNVVDGEFQGVFTVFKAATWFSYVPPPGAKPTALWSPERRNPPQLSRNVPHVYYKYTAIGFELHRNGTLNHIVIVSGNAVYIDPVFIDPV